jgi:tetratricopeptide (TPR) repeat protein
MRRCRRRILFIFGGLFLAATLFVPYHLTRVSYERDAQTNLVWKQEARRGGYMFLFRYLQRSRERPADVAGRDFRYALYRTEKVTSDRYKLRTPLLIYELVAIVFLGTYDYVFICRRFRRREKRRIGMQKRILFLFFAAVFFVGCAVRQAVTPPPAGGEAPPLALDPAEVVRIEEMIAEAETLVERGGYVHLRRAFALYQDIETAVPDSGRFAASYADAALLLAARAREMGIRNPAYLAKARELIRTAENPAVPAAAAAIVDFVPVMTLGIWDDNPYAKPGREAMNLAAAAAGELFAAKAVDGPFFVFFNALFQEYSGKTDEAVADLDKARAMFPGSRLLKFKRAAMAPSDVPLLEEIAAEDSEFHESFLALGRAAVSGGFLLTAEKNLLRAWEGIPESPLTAILLASVNMGTEEFDRGLVFYEKTLEQAPDYKEARLGMAVSLSLLGRPAEAVPILEDLPARGPALSGEAFFWLAFNRHALGERESAAAAVEKAKTILPAARVFTLAGTIAFERGLFEAAETDFKKAVEIDAGESEAFFHLGKLCAMRSAWTESALNYMIAARGFEFDEKAIREKIAQIKESDLPEDRKGRLLVRKAFQAEKTRLSGATASFNAAAGYFNAGSLRQALEWVRRAGEHPYFKEKAKDFIALIADGK